MSFCVAADPTEGLSYNSYLIDCERDDEYTSFTRSKPFWYPSLCCSNLTKVRWWLVLYLMQHLKTAESPKYNTNSLSKPSTFHVNIPKTKKY